MNSTTRSKLRSFNSCIFLSLLALCNSAFAECSKAQAHRKMQALGLAQTRNSKTERDPDPIKDWERREQQGNFSMELAGVGSLLAENNFNKACQRYEEIAKKYNIDLASLEKEVPNAASSAGGTTAIPAKTAGKCSSPMDATMLNVKLMEAIQDKAARGEAGQQDVNAYLAEMGEFAGLFTTDPARACVLLKGLQQKYGL